MLYTPCTIKEREAEGGGERERDKSEDTSFDAVPQQILAINVCPSAVGYSDS